MGQGKHGGGHAKAGTDHSGQTGGSSTTQQSQNGRSWTGKKRGAWKGSGQKPSGGSGTGR